MAPGSLQHPGRAVRQDGPEYQHWKESWNGLSPVSGGRNTFGGGVRETDDVRGFFLPVESAYLGTVHGVRGGYGARVTGVPHAYASWEESGY